MENNLMKSDIYKYRMPLYPKKTAFDKANLETKVRYNNET